MVYMICNDQTHCSYDYIRDCGQLMNRPIVYWEFIEFLNEVNVGTRLVVNFNAKFNWKPFMISLTYIYMHV